MKKIIHRLRQKSEEERRHLLHFFTFVAAILLIVFWIFTLSRDVVTQETKEDIKSDLQPFAELKDTLINTNSTTEENTLN